MSITINKDNVMQLVRQAVNLKGPNHIDPNSQGSGCKYFDAENERASCIVGTVFELAGVGVEELTLMDRSGTVSDLAYFKVHELNGTSPDSYAGDDHFPPSVTIDLHAIAVLRAAQRIQDNADTWGAALRAAHMVDVLIRSGGDPNVIIHNESML